MTLQDRISSLESQLTEWQSRRQQASEALTQAQAAILQLQGALTLARTLADEAAVPVGSPNDEPPPALLPSEVLNARD